MVAIKTLPPLDPRFQELYLLLLEGQDHQAWIYFTNLCRNEGVNREQMFEHLAFDFRHVLS